MGNLLAHDEDETGARSSQPKNPPLKSILKNNNDYDQVHFGTSFSPQHKMEKTVFPRFKVDPDGQVRTVSDERKVAFPDQRVPKMQPPPPPDGYTKFANGSGVNGRAETVIRERRTRITKVISSVTSSVEEMEEVERRVAPGSRYSERKTSQYVDETLSKSFPASQERAEAEGGRVQLQRSESLQLASGSERPRGGVKLRQVVGSVTRPFKSRQHVRVAFNRGGGGLEPTDEDAAASFPQRAFLPQAARDLSAYELGGQPLYPPSSLVRSHSYGNMFHPFSTGAQPEARAPQPEVRAPQRKAQAKLVRRRQNDAVSLDEHRPYVRNWNWNWQDPPDPPAAEGSTRSTSLRSYLPSKTLVQPSFAFPRAYTANYEFDRSSTFTDFNDAYSPRGNVWSMTASASASAPAAGPRSQSFRSASQERLQTGFTGYLQAPEEANQSLATQQHANYTYAGSYL